MAWLTGIAPTANCYINANPNLNTDPNPDLKPNPVLNPNLNLSENALWGKMRWRLTTVYRCQHIIIVISVVFIPLFC